MYCIYTIYESARAEPAKLPGESNFHVIEAFDYNRPFDLRRDNISLINGQAWRIRPPTVYRAGNKARAYK